MNDRDRNFTSAKLERRMRDIESSIARFLEAMDTADRQEPAIAKARTERLQDKIAALKEQMRSLQEIEVKLNEAGRRRHVDAVEQLPRLSRLGARTQPQRA